MRYLDDEARIAKLEKRKHILVSESELIAFNKWWTEHCGFTPVKNTLFGIKIKKPDEIADLLKNPHGKTN